MNEMHKAACEHKQEMKRIKAQEEKAPGSPLLEVRHLTIRYADAPEPVVKDLNFCLYPGEIVCLHGDSGRGKSTVVWALTEMLGEYNGLAEGEICLAGKVLRYENGRPVSTKRTFGWGDIALVPQSSMSSFHPLFTIRRTMRETMKACGCEGDRHSQEERMRELMHRVKLEPEVLDAYPHELSGGMKQRAAIALALLFHPDLLILDEATTGLDLLTEARVMQTILELREKQNMTILLISHDRRLAEAVCDREIEL